MVGMVGELSAYLATFRDEICRRDSDGWNILSKAIYDLLWKRVQARRPALFASSKDGSTPSLTKQVSEGGFRDTCDDFRRLARLYRVEGCSASMEFTMLSGLVRRIDVVSKDPSEDLRDGCRRAASALRLGCSHRVSTLDRASRSAEPAQKNRRAYSNRSSRHM